MEIVVFSSFLVFPFLDKKRSKCRIELMMHGVKMQQTVYEVCTGQMLKVKFKGVVVACSYKCTL